MEEMNNQIESLLNDIKNDSKSRLFKDYSNDLSVIMYKLNKNLLTDVFQINVKPSFIYNEKSLFNTLLEDYDVLTFTNEIPKLSKQIKNNNISYLSNPVYKKLLKHAENVNKIFSYTNKPVHKNTVLN